jgi:hypothetical protein
VRVREQRLGQFLLGIRQDGHVYPGLTQVLQGPAYVFVRREVLQLAQNRMALLSREHDILARGSHLQRGLGDGAERGVVAEDGAHEGALAQLREPGAAHLVGRGK